MRIQLTWISVVFLMITSIQCTMADVSLVKVEKSKRLMYLLDDTAVVKIYPIALGGNPVGHKTQEGDERTPEGNYTLDYIKEDSSFYRAMHISYPNQQDIAQAEDKGVSPGGFIMIHGQRNGLGWLSGLTQKIDWTNGCIAITNQHMDEFLTLVKVGTPILIEP
ncbi:L,D-transpeptidase family protein [Neptunomonas phycophila]|uniref:L,D-transpeptidase family protein n=1 Tax=Neptunomonas phycophila TaxID=1572645 RepID=UPI001FE4B767|nr:L,D-transpeptidase family protein [Neptunomonas phycophila]